MASDRVRENENGGVVAFVTNGGFIDSNSFDGFRKSLVREFHKIYVVNLRGTIRQGGFLPKARREEEGASIFEKGTTSGCAILMLVKKPGHVDGSGTLFYYDTIDSPIRSREQKLKFLSDNSKSSTPWREIAPDPHGDWINHRDPGFQTLLPLYGEAGAVFNLNSLGIITARDTWCYGFSRTKVVENTRAMIESYNRQVPTSEPIRDPKEFSWTRKTLRMAKGGIRLKHDTNRVVSSVYRPFTKQAAYFHRSVNEEVYQQERIFPESDLPNVGIAVNARDKNNPMSCLMLESLPNYHTIGDSQFLPRWIYEKVLSGDGLEKVSNINPTALTKFQTQLGADSITEDDLFYYVYGVLHHPAYRTRYADNLSREAPRIPMASSLTDFNTFAEAGMALADLHVTYESVELYPLEEEVTGEPDMIDMYRVTTKKMKHPGTRGNLDESSLVYNDFITLRGIPEKAHEYVLGQYTALRWLMDRYHIKTDKASGIVNDPNDWGAEHGDPRYILDLIKRIVTVSVQTVEIVDGLPDLPSK